MKTPVLKKLWRICGIIGIAIVSWSLWDIQTREHALGDMVWLLLCGCTLLASACCFYLAWEKAVLLTTDAEKRKSDNHDVCNGGLPENENHGGSR